MIKLEEKIATWIKSLTWEPAMIYDIACVLYFSAPSLHSVKATLYSRWCVWYPLQDSKNCLSRIFLENLIAIESRSFCGFYYRMSFRAITKSLPRSDGHDLWVFQSAAQRGMTGILRRPFHPPHVVVFLKVCQCWLCHSPQIEGHTGTLQLTEWRIVTSMALSEDTVSRVCFNHSLFYARHLAC